jgi:hypothetical protein
MAHDATSLTRFDTPTALVALEAAFDGATITADGGLPWLAQEGDSELGGVCRSLLAECVPEWCASACFR